MPVCFRTYLYATISYTFLAAVFLPVMCIDIEVYAIITNDGVCAISIWLSYMERLSVEEIVKCLKTFLLCTANDFQARYYITEGCCIIKRVLLKDP